MRRLGLVSLVLLLCVLSTQTAHAVCLLCGLCACGPANYSCGGRLCYHYGCWKSCVMSGDYCCPGAFPRGKPVVIVAMVSAFELDTALVEPYAEVVPADGSATLEADVAASLSIPASSIHLRKSFVMVDSAGYLSHNPGIHGWKVGDRGFMIRRDPMEGGIMRYRVCRFTPGGPPTLVVDKELESKTTLLTSLDLFGTQTILAVRMEVLDDDTWNASYEQYQADLWSDVGINIEESSLTIDPADASADCE